MTGQMAGCVLFESSSEISSDILSLKPKRTDILFKYIGKSVSCQWF